MGKTTAEQECAHVVKHGIRLLLLGIPPKLTWKTEYESVQLSKKSVAFGKRERCKAELRGLPTADWTLLGEQRVGPAYLEVAWTWQTLSNWKVNSQITEVIGVQNVQNDTTFARQQMREALRLPPTPVVRWSAGTHGPRIHGSPYFWTFWVSSGKWSPKFKCFWPMWVVLCRPLVVNRAEASPAARPWLGCTIIGVPWLGVGMSAACLLAPFQCCDAPWVIWTLHTWLDIYCTHDISARKHILWVTQDFLVWKVLFVFGVANIVQLLGLFGRHWDHAPKEEIISDLQAKIKQKMPQPSNQIGWYLLKSHPKTFSWPHYTSGFPKVGHPRLGGSWFWSLDPEIDCAWLGHSRLCFQKKIQQVTTQWTLKDPFGSHLVYSPHHCGVFVFFLASRPSPVPSAAAASASASRLPITHLTHNSSHTTHLTHNLSHTTHLTHNSSHTTTNLSHTQLISHTTHLSHNSSHTKLISHNQLISHTTHLTHNSSLTQLISQLLISHNSSHTQLISHNSSHTQLISHNSSHTTHLTQLISHNSSHTIHLTHNSSHTIHLTHNSSHTTHLTQLISRNSSHTTHLTHLISQTCCLAGAVHRASWRSCGADCRRSGRGCSWRGRRSTQSFLKELRRGLSPEWPRLLFVWQAQYTELPEGAAARIVAGVAAAALCVAGAVHRASWRSCGADCRRSGRGCSLCGRRSTQSLLKELRRGLSPQWPRLLFVWQAQYTVPPEGAAARIVAGVAAAALCVAGAVHRASWRSCGADCRRSGRGCSSCGRRSTQSFLKELRRGLSPEWPRLLFVWQAQYTEPPEGAAARIVAAVAAAALCVAGAVHRASWRSCGADCRRSGRGWLVAAVISAFAEEVSVWQICVAAVILVLAEEVSVWQICLAAVLLAFAEEVSLWQICVAAVILAFAEEVSLRQICLAAVILAFAEEVSLWQICVAAVILAFAEEVSLRQICVAAVILAFAKEVSLRQICVAAVILAFAKEVSLWQTCVVAVILAFLT